MKIGNNKYKINSKISLPVNEYISFKQPGVMWYPQIQISPNTIGRLATDTKTLVEAIDILKKLEPDDYSQYLLGYYQSGLTKFGDNWGYADIVTALSAASKLTKPQNYLEIGVRRGRSLSMVAVSNPSCSIFGFDMWVDNYANMSNPGEDFVRSEMQKIGFTGKLEFINGDSHVTLEKFFSENPDTFFDLITVDGDHSKQGAILDLEQVKTRLKIGGVLVFDDITHPSHPYLLDVWKKHIKADERFSTWEYDELGYGVAVGIRLK